MLNNYRDARAGVTLLVLKTTLKHAH